MKTQAILISLTLFAAAPAAQADSVVQISQSTNRILVAMNRDLEFLASNMKDCTKYSAKIEKMMLDPLGKDIQTAQGHIRNAFGKLAEEKSRDCVRPTEQDLTKAASAADQIFEAVDSKLELAETPSGRLFGMTPDSALTKAMTAATDGSWPTCRPEDKNNPASTPQLKTYRSLKQKMVMVRAMMKSLKEETVNLIRGKGEEVCKITK